MLHQILDALTDRRAVVKSVVRIQPGDDLAARHRPAFVDRGGLAHILVRFPSNSVAVSCKDIGSFVGRSVIEDDVLDIRVVLREDALDRVAQKIGLVVSRRDNGHCW